jgi:hypothetical protein
MSLTVASEGAYYLLRFSMGGVEVTGVPHGHAEFQLLVDGTQINYTMHEFHTSDGWANRSVSLERLYYLSDGSHTIVVQWSVRSPDARPALPPWIAEARATLRGCSNNENRQLIAIEF